MNRFLILGMLLSVVLLEAAGAEDRIIRGNATAPSKGEQQAVSISDLERVLLKEITRRYGRPHHQIHLRVLFPNKPIEVQQGTVRLDVEEVAGGRTGRRAFRVKVFVNQQYSSTINVVGELTVNAEVVRPARWIAPKEVLSEEDVEMVNVAIPSLVHDFVLTPDDVVGKQANRSLTPHQPIRAGMVQAPPVIHKGDRVLIEVRSHGLLVQTVGTAKAAGKTGDTIPVQNQSSGREVLGKIVDSGVVEVPF
jgi:flagella basal body P-ring formation protein FlgA